MDTCETCVYRDGDQCRAHPPRGNQWARVADDDWCGEHAKKPEPVVEPDPKPKPKLKLKPRSKS